MQEWLASTMTKAAFLRHIPVQLVEELCPELLQLQSLLGSLADDLQGLRILVQPIQAVRLLEVQ